MPGAEFAQLRYARHGAVLVHDFADHAGGVEAGETRKIDRGFRLPGTDQHAAIARAQGENVAGPREVVGHGAGLDRGENGPGAIGRGDARGDAVARIDGFAERRAEIRSIVRRHQGQAKGVAAFAGERQADQAAPEGGHEIDDFGRHLFGGNGQVAFVLAIFVVDDDKHAPGASFLDGLGNGSEWHRCPKFHYSG